MPPFAPTDEMGSVEGRRRSSFFSAARAAMLLSCTGVVAGCYQPEYSAAAPYLDAGTDDMDAWTPEDAASEAGDDAAQAAGPARQLSFRVTTFPLGGRFVPLNVGAIWIESSEGSFVRTLALWGVVRNRYLRTFQKASGGDTVDAVTSATLTNHETHEVTWDLRDRMQQPVADGEYRLLAEMTDRNAMGALVEVPFTVGPDPFTAIPEDTPQFRDMLLSVETLE